MVNFTFTRLALAVWISLLGGLPGHAEEARPPLTLFAAASLGDALASVLAAWPGEVRLSLGGSGAMARQIDHGAPADAVMLANPEWMDWLEERGRLVPESRRSPLSNNLVLVGPPGADPLPSVSLDDVLTRLGPDGRIAIGEHRSVPAGQYAQTWLTAKALWEPLRARLAEVENVRAALALVSRGEVPLAIVYTSDLVAAADAATPVWTIPPGEQPDIRYSLAAVTPAGLDLVEWMSSPDARAGFATFGFVGIEE